MTGVIIGLCCLYGCRGIPAPSQIHITFMDPSKQKFAVTTVSCCRNCHWSRYTEIQHTAQPSMPSSQPRPVRTCLWLTEAMKPIAAKLRPQKANWSVQNCCTKLCRPLELLGMYTVVSCCPCPGMNVPLLLLHRNDTPGDITRHIAWATTAWVVSKVPPDTRTGKTQGKEENAVS